jgi:hypothetical protein
MDDPLSHLQSFSSLLSTQSSPRTPSLGAGQDVHVFDGVLLMHGPGLRAVASGREPEATRVFGRTPAASADELLTSSTCAGSSPSFTQGDGAVPACPSLCPGQVPSPERPAAQQFLGLAAQIGRDCGGRGGGFSGFGSALSTQSSPCMSTGGSPRCPPSPTPEHQEQALIVKAHPARLATQSEQFANELTQHLGICAPSCRILRKLVRAAARLFAGRAPP